MLRSLTIAALAALLLLGCGGGGPPGSDATVSYDFGTVRIEGASGLQHVQIGSPNISPLLFTGYYGAQITRLTTVGYGRLAFVSAAAGSCDVYVIGEDGSGWQRLTTWPYDETNPQYSRDGARIVFSCQVSGTNTEIYSMAADGSDIVRLTQHPAHDDYADFSPDGSAIVFESDRTGNYEIWRMNADGSAPVNLTNAAGSDERLPRWSPDGRRIVYGSTHGGQEDIWMMGRDGARPTRLTDTYDPDGHAAWSPDGRQIAFVSYRHMESRVYTMSANGAGEITRSEALPNPASPCFSPDGTRLAYSVGTGAIRSQSLITGEYQDVLEVFGDGGSPAWCPRPTTLRCLVGSTRSDGGSEPPFGSARPLAIVGVSPDGLVEAVTVDVLSSMWSSISMVALENTGSSLAGVEIEATQIDAVREDVGRGVSPRVWSTPGRTATRSAIVIFNATTGRITSVLASAVASGAATRAVTSEAGTLVIAGPSDAVWGADPDQNLAPAGAARVALDARTGTVLEIVR